MTINKALLALALGFALAACSNQKQAEDSAADADSNFVLTEGGGIVEVQGTAEKTPFSEAEFLELMRLARHGTGHLFAAQRAALGE